MRIALSIVLSQLTDNLWKSITDHIAQKSIIAMAAWFICLLKSGCCVCVREQKRFLFGPVTKVLHKCCSHPDQQSFRGSCRLGWIVYLIGPLIYQIAATSLTLWCIECGCAQPLLFHSASLFKALCIRYLNQSLQGQLVGVGAPRSQVRSLNGTIAYSCIKGAWTRWP